MHDFLCGLGGAFSVLIFLPSRTTISRSGRIASLVVVAALSILVVVVFP